MSGEKQYQPQSISISGSQVSGQISMGGRDVIQYQMTANEMSASVDVVVGLAQIEELRVYRLEYASF